MRGYWDITQSTVSGNSSDDIILVSDLEKV
jgi:hypothetical protein